MSDTVEIECNILGESDSAIKIEFESEVMWLPLSTVDKIVRNPHGEDTLKVKRWIAEKKGLV